MSNSYFIERHNCPACNHTIHNELYSSPFLENPVKRYLIDFYKPQGDIELAYLEGADYTLLKCKRCSLVFQKYIGSDFLLEKLYDEWLDPDLDYKNHVKKAALDSYAFMAQEIMTIIAYFGGIPNQVEILDFGTGWGRYPLMAKAFGCHAYGSELSSNRVNYFESQGIQNIGWDEIPNHKFDFIATEQVFEHLSEPLPILEHLKKALKPDGLIKISVPNGRDIEQRLETMDWDATKGTSKSLNPVAPLEHINCFNHKSIVTMGEMCGLEEAKLPIRDQLVFSTNWKPGVRFIKNLLRPFYQNLTNRSTRVFFRCTHA